MTSLHLLRWILFFTGFLTHLKGAEIRIATYNVLTGIGPSGDPERDALEEVLARIDADVLGLQEVTGSDSSGGNLTSLASNLGYQYTFTAGPALDTNSRVILLSKHPFRPGSAESIISPPGANDMTRAAAAAIVDVPGTTNDPVIVTAHLKCCSDFDDPFRRAVEMLRIRKYLESLGIDGTDNVFVMGDFNLLGGNQVYATLPFGLPPSYRLGNDIEFNVSYFSNPTSYFSGLGLVNPGYRQQDGVTTDTYRGSSSVLDHLLVSSAVAARMPTTEIYNSRLDSSFPGLPKSGPPLPPITSDVASDHYPVFGDFRLDGGLELSVAVTPSVLDENSPPAEVSVTFVTPPSSPLTLILQSSDPSEAVLEDLTIQVPAGASRVTTSLRPLLDKISDGDQSITVSASASGYQGSPEVVTIRNADPLSYVFNDTSTPVIEDFDNFAGTQSLSAWDNQGVIWQGRDDGSLSILGGRSYQNSLGFLTSEPMEFRTTFRNDSPDSIDALSIACLAQHWRRFENGSADRIEFFFEKNNLVQSIPALIYQPSTTGPGEKLSPPESVSLYAYLRDLNLGPGQELDLLVKVSPGEGVGSVSDDVFINEFHYDNSGSDQGEFIEIAVGSGFTGNLSSIAVQFYNGSNGEPYGSTHSLDSFQAGASSPGEPNFYFKMIPGIQNGGPDGIALSVGGVVREFVSYEGNFVASGGMASGLISKSVGVSQGPGTPVGRNSIARSGSGATADDFSWIIHPGDHTPGEANAGQTFGASPQPQGLAIDDLVVTPLRDLDGDMLPDLEELDLGTDPARADSDSDGQSDFFEAILAQTDPLSGSSYLKPVLVLEDDGVRVEVPSIAERWYQVEFSEDLETWEVTPSMEGDGSPKVFHFTAGHGAFFRVRISLSAP